MVVERGHIVNCQDIETYERFLNSGFAGVRPKKPKDNAPTTKGRALRTNWSIIADLKRVKPGDLIFIHVTGGEQEIKGVFEATSIFMESPHTPEPYQSKNLRYSGKSDCWQKYRKRDFVDTDFFWQVGIKPHKNYLFEDGFESNEVFRLVKEGRIWTIPERWRYEDGAKTVRPLMGSEIGELKKLLVRNNLGEPWAKRVRPMNLKKSKKIEMLLTPHDGELYKEKILEGWILENLTDNGDNSKDFEMVTNILGNMNVFGNTIQAFYLDFMDIFGYIQDEEGFQYGFKVVELKKGYPEKLPGTIRQLTKYMNWVTNEHANGDSIKVEGLIIAKDFSKSYAEYVNLRNRIEYGNRIGLIRYELEKGELVLTEVTEV